jgi:hypothetical protein
METRKYRLTEETMEWRSRTLHRIEALNDFGNVKAGDKGGWIEKVENLNQEGDAWVYGDAKVYGGADYIVFKNWWSSGRYFTWTRSNNMWNVGCFFGTGEELIRKAYADSEKSGREYERIVKYVESILADENNE